MIVEAEEEGGGTKEREKKKDGWRGGEWRQSLLSTAEKNKFFLQISPPVGSRLVLQRPWWMQLLPDPTALLAASHYRMERFPLEVARSWHFISSGFPRTHPPTHIYIYKGEQQRQQQQQSSGSFLNIQAWWHSQCARSWLAGWLSTQLGWALSLIFFFFLVRGGSRDRGRGGVKEGSSILHLPVTSHSAYLSSTGCRKIHSTCFWWMNEFINWIQVFKNSILFPVKSILHSAGYQTSIARSCYRSSTQVYQL